jgi:signal transduction histidine kinase
MKNVAALRKRVMLAEAAANQAKTKLLAMLSHEIRTPMNTVARLMGVVQRDLDGQLSVARLATFRQVEQACEQLLATLDDLLHFSATSGSQVGRTAPSAFLLENLLNECGEIVSFAAREKGISLSIDAAQVLPIEVLGQPHQLKRVLLNLLVNAIKFTQQGGVTVHASLRREGGNQARMVIAVTDTGIGIPPEEHKNIFQLFYQVDSSYARRFNGSGLGLAISQQLAEAMGGTITVVSQVEQGSTFTISLALPMLREVTPQNG